MPIAFSHCLLSGEKAARLPWPCLTHGLCVPPLAGGSGIHRPVAKKATPGAEYKAKVRAAGGARTLLAESLGKCGAAVPIAALERHLCGASLRPH